MAAKPRKRQLRNRRPRAGRRRRGGGWSFPAGRLRLAAFVGLAIAAGALLGYGLGLLNRPAPEQPVVTEARQAPPGPRVETQPKSAAQTSAAARRATAPRPSAAESRPRVESRDDAPRPPAAAPAEAAWIRNAVASAEPADKPAIAIVIDDVGLNPAQTRKVTALPAPMTLAFLTYAEGLPDQAARARAAGHELLVHFPMEPVDPSVDPGPNALLGSLAESEIAERLRWGLTRFEGYVGVNNHMGSLFTADEVRMDIVLRELKGRGLLFLDSWTSPNSAGPRISRRLELPHAVRDVFLDNSKDRVNIRASLALLEARAKARGQAIGIGHPYDETIDEIAAWIEGARERGFAFVPVTEVVRRVGAPPRQLGGSGVPADPAG